MIAPALHPDVLRIPVAHRGLHGGGVPENSLAAARAAVAAGYAIECDIQPAGDGTPMVFHDHDLPRLTGAGGLIAAQPPAAIAALRLRGAGDHPVPTLDALLETVAGRVPLLVEVKDPSGVCGAEVGPLPARVAARLARYDGPVAAMSFNPAVVAAMRAAAPDLCLGLTTCAFAEDDWPMVPPARRAELAAIADYDAVGAAFVSHDHTDLARARVAALRAVGAGVLCWTIRSAAAEAAARAWADNITFEGYAPSTPAPAA